MSFRERMAGRFERADGRSGRLAFELQARSPTLLRPLGTTFAEAQGRIDVDGIATEASTSGHLELSPLRRRRMRYVLDFRADDGNRYRLDSVKRIRPWSLPSWTTLRGAIEHSDGGHWGRAEASFALRDIPALAASVRLWRPPRPHERGELMAPRWRGQPERLEVWYATVTDPGTGTGFWFHHELLAPAHGTPRRQGWVVAFPAEGEPVVERFAGDAAADAGAGQLLFAADGATVRDGALEGQAGALAWDLAYSDSGPPLYTFPRAVWERELLPGAQVVPAPSARFSGVVTVAGRRHELEAAPGAVARIYGHGNAERWGWLHADLGAGDAIEVVAAVSRRRVLDRLPPLAFVQLRKDGRDWPRNPLLAAPALRTELREDGFTTHGRLGSRRLRAEVGLPRRGSVTLRYDDPAGDGPRCTNSEIADLDLLVERRGPGGWRVERHAELRGGAHAEVGRRP